MRGDSAIKQRPVWHPWVVTKAIEGPLAKHLREIAEERRPVPSTAARRHHFVPSFALSQFATPRKRDGVLFKLDTQSGRPKKTTPDASCFVEELYSQDNEGALDRTLEAFFSIVENYAAKALSRLLADPLGLRDEDRQTLAYYFAFQYQRTPVALEHSAASQQATMAVMLGLRFADPDSFRVSYREQFGDDASQEEIEAFRHKTLTMLKGGEIAFDKPKLGAFQMMLQTADALASTIASLSWVLIEAQEDEFIISDRSLAMHDPTPKFPWSGHALRSSLRAQTTFPLSPHRCLALVQAEPPTIVAAADAEDVRELNLRIYGWASEFIYGRTQELLQRVRAEAKRRPEQVIRPRTPKPVILEEADSDDPTVGIEHVKKGWPRGVMVADEDGGERFCSYQLVDPDDQGSVEDVISAEEAIQRAFAAERATAAGRDEERGDDGWPDL